MKKYLFLSLVFFACLMAREASAQRLDQIAAPAVSSYAGGGQSEEIAAVVNDGIISTSDIRARLAMALLSSNLPDTTEVRQKLMPQVLRGLIDEQLQMQEAKRLEISVTDDEIKQALARVSAQNNIPGGDMEAFLSSRNVPPSTIRSQIKATLSWSKIIARDLRPRIEVSDDEVQSAIERIQANAGKQEYLISEILLTVDTAKDEEQIKSLADQLTDQIKNGGNFGAIARQFSQGTGAANGGDIGWTQVGQLPSELNALLAKSQPGDIIGPVRSTNGFHILGIREMRTVAAASPKDISVNLQQVFYPFRNGQTKEGMLKEADRLRNTINSCSHLRTTLQRSFPGWYWQDLGEVDLGKAPAWIVEKTNSLSEGRASEAMATDKGALLLFVCGRKVSSTINRDEVLNAIGTERLEVLARRKLRDLRRDSHLDIRIKSVP